MRRLRIMLLCAVLLGPAAREAAADTSLLALSAPVTYSCVLGYGVLTASDVTNLSIGGYSGTLHLELWAFPAPFTGNLTVGYKLAQFTFGPLTGGYHISGLSSGVVACASPPAGTWYVSMVLTEYTFYPFNGGFETADWVNFDQPWVVDGGPVTPPPPPPPSGIKATAIEYYHAGFDHYFITAYSDEIAKLDSGVFAGWARTGQAFNVYADAPSGSSPVCRFFSTAFAPKSSHFYTPDPTECAIVNGNRSWQYEAVVFNVARPNSNGNCSSGTTPVYRLYNNGQGGAPNHRYTTNLAVRSQMLGRGWVPEGYGPIGVVMCAPQ